MLTAPEIEAVICPVCRLRRDPARCDDAGICDDCQELINDSDTIEHPMTRANVCDVCHALPLPGVLWSPTYVPQGHLQILERCDACERYDSDRAAAEAVARHTGLVAVRDPQCRGDHDDHEYWTGCAAVCKPGHEPMHQQHLFDLDQVD